MIDHEYMCKGEHSFLFLLRESTSDEIVAAMKPEEIAFLFGFSSALAHTVAHCHEGKSKESSTDLLVALYAREMPKALKMARVFYRPETEIGRNHEQPNGSNS